ncbi:flavin-linked sulfhydryl oxidase [Aspergillus candidus]|uniref:Sulfhydryl oxidase n=1 Tax=Aspergillus candidus TaxID=41067 RepID=A0A2I2FCW0_ASPCN|nr:ERV/ALR sulfhydryl oxidase domain-containing protein [Aspergillus candidus]PLB38427.1 ERV/ALR sulfhydryl oxidase domain-containing protein [Aspergillus candidus]
MSTTSSQPQNPTPKTLFMHQTPAAAGPTEGTKDEHTGLTKLPNGVVLDKDGKPCRLCTSAASWRSLTKQAKASPSSSSSSSSSTPASSTTSTSSPPPPKASPTAAASTAATAAAAAAASSTTLPTESQTQCPPDVEELGRSTWTLLHSMTAAYPARASPEQQTDMQSFLRLFGRLYPCWVCADDFRTWMAEPSGRNQPRLGGRSEFGTWMCEAHNAVNRKLGKREFDCRFWEERWRTGWKDGRCD